MPEAITSVLDISIHAPTRGATDRKSAKEHDENISIHAPTRGATRSRNHRLSRCLDLNTSYHQGSDGVFGVLCLSDTYFNPRSHKGSDGILAVFIDMDMVFQSTLPQGERRKGRPSDHGIREISIHAPTRGATPALIPLVRMSQPFQSTLPQGERQPYTPVIRTARYFNPRSHKGSDALQLDPRSHHGISIHAPTRGATLTRKSVKS